MTNENMNAGQPEQEPPKETAAQTPQEPQSGEPEQKEVLDDNDYRPDFIQKDLDNPPILPGEDPHDFLVIFESIEFGNFSKGRPKTDTEYSLVWQATTLSWELKRWEKMKLKIISSQGRPAAEAVFRRTLHVMVPEGDVEDPKAAARELGYRYFASPDLRSSYDKTLEKAGYGSGAVDAEICLRSLPSLTTIEKLVAGLNRRLSNIRKELNQAYASRDPEEEMPESPAAKRANDEFEKRWANKNGK